MKKSIKNTTEIAVVTAQAQINNNINLSLNQNDLIELAIQEKLEELEGMIKSTEDRIIENRKEQEELISSLAKDLFKKQVSNKQIEMLNKFYKLLGVDPENQYVYNLTKHRKEELGKYTELYSSRDNYTTLQQFTRNSTERIWYKVAFHNLIIETKYHNSTEYLGILLNYGNTTELKESDKLRLNKALTPLDTEAYQLHLKIYELYKEEANYKFSEKKIKAKFVKESLKKTQQGLEILGMLQSATNIKLLG